MKLDDKKRKTESVPRHFSDPRNQLLCKTTLRKTYRATRTHGIYRPLLEIQITRLTRPGARYQIAGSPVLSALDLILVGFSFNEHSQVKSMVRRPAGELH